MANLHEECGVFGVYSPKPGPVADLAYYGLYALQHRGQESCGIVVNDDGVFASRKDIGLVNEVFSRDDLMKFPQGRMAVAHARYGTTGGNSRANCQPIEVNHQKGKMALAHNGNLSNAYELRSELELGGAIFHTTSDTEIIAYIVTQARLNSPSIENALSSAMNRLEGAYSLVLMSAAKLLAARDPYGFRPLCYGKTLDGTYVVASESCALSAARYSSLTKTACARTGITAAKSRGAHAFLSISILQDRTPSLTVYPSTRRAKMPARYFQRPIRLKPMLLWASRIRESTPLWAMPRRREYPTEWAS